MSDLKRFIKQRQSLNAANIYLKYIFHCIQTAGLLTTSVAQSYGWSNIIWVGIGLTSLATLIHIYEQTNNSISKHMLESISKIKNGIYIDEDILVDTEEDEKKSNNTNNTQSVLQTPNDNITIDVTYNNTSNA